MNNLFGIGILLELKDKITARLQGVSRSMDNLESQAEQTVRQVNALNDELENSGSSFDSGINAINSFGDSVGVTSENLSGFSRRMAELEHILGTEVPETTRQAYTEMINLQNEIHRSSRAYGSYSRQAQEARDRLNSWALSLDDTTFKHIYMRNQLGLSERQIKQQANSILLNARMTRLMGNQIQIVEDRLRALQQVGIRPEHFLPPSTPGMFQTLNNVMGYNISRVNLLSSGFRTLGASIEGVIKNFSAQKVAIRLAGDDLIRYNRILMSLTNMTTNLALALPMVGAGALVFYGGLYGTIMKTNEQFATLVDTVKGKLLKAFEPLLQVATEVGTIFLNLVGAIADMVTKFNEAHPVLAKLLATIGFMLPVLTMFSLTVSGGVGIIRGWAVALNSVWATIGGLVTMIGTASSTALAFASVIAGVVVGLKVLWVTNEGFRNAVISIWGNIKTFVGDCVNNIKSYLTDLTNAFKEGGLIGGLEFLGSSLLNGFTSVLTSLDIIIENVVNYMVDLVTNIEANLPKLMESGKNIIKNIVQGVSEKAGELVSTGSSLLDKFIGGLKTGFNTLIEVGSNIVDNLVTGISIIFPKLLSIGGELISMLLTGIITYAPQIITKAGEILNGFLTKAGEVVPKMLDVGVNMIRSLIDGISSNLPALLDIGIQCLLSWVNNLVTNLPLVLQAGSTVIQSLLDGILNSLPLLLSSGGAIIKAILDSLISSAGDIINGAITILNGLVQGILDNLPMLLTVATNLLNTLVTYIIENLPIILNAGIQIITTLIQGIIDSLPMLLEVGLNIITNLLQGIITNIPNILLLGVQVINTLVQGILSNLPMLVTMGGQLISSLISTLLQALPQLLSVGVNMVSSLIQGISQMVPNLLSTFSNMISNIISSLVNSLPKFLEQGKNFITNIVSGVNNTKNSLIQAFTNVINNVKSTISNTVSSFVSIGKSIIEGLAKGISNGVSSVVNAISNVVNGAIKAGKKLLGINSPSRVFKQIGAWTSEGLSIGIDKDKYRVDNSIRNVTTNMITNTETMVSSVKSKLENPNIKSEIPEDIMLSKEYTMDINHRGIIEKMPEDKLVNNFNNRGVETTRGIDFNLLTKATQVLNPKANNDNTNYNTTKVIDNQNKTEIKNEFNITIQGDISSPEFDVKSKATELYNEIKRLMELDNSFNWNSPNEIVF